MAQTVSPAERTLRVLLIGGHPLSREALALLLAADTGVRVVGDGDDAAGAFARASGAPPDVALVDIDRDPGAALATLADVAARAPEAKALVLTGSIDRDLGGRLVLAGARGVVSKDRGGGHLRDALRKVDAGELWIDRATTAQIIAGVAQRRAQAAVDPEAAKIASLTPREREVVALVAQGRSNRAIADAMKISDNTVRHHLTSVFTKLDVRDRLALAIYSHAHKVG